MPTGHLQKTRANGIERIQDYSSCDPGTRSHQTQGAMGATDATEAAEATVLAESPAPPHSMSLPPKLYIPSMIERRAPLGPVG